MEKPTELPMTNPSLTRGSHQAQWLQKVFWTMVYVQKNGWKWQPSHWWQIFHWQEEAIEHNGCKRCFEQWWAYAYSSDGEDDSFHCMGLQMVCFERRPTASHSEACKYLNLINKQSIKFKSSKTQSKLPSMMQAQIQATNVRWGGANLKSLVPCLMSMPNTTIRNNQLSTL